MIRPLLLSVLLMSANALAGELIPMLETVNGAGSPVVLHDVRIIKVDSDGIRVLHSTGSAKVPFERLPKDLQAKYAAEASSPNQPQAAVKAPAPPTTATSTPTSASAAPIAAAPAQAQMATKDTIKAAWLAECESCFICPSDPQGAAKRQALAQRISAIRSGAWDSKAEEYAKQANARSAGKTR